jgi:hypothetical protein
MGPYPHICRLQSCGSGLLRYLLCSLPNYLTETFEICYIVSDDVLFPAFCGYAFDTFGTPRLMSETLHPLGKLAPLQLPVEPAVSYAGEEYSSNQQSKNFDFHSLNFFILSFLSSLNPKRDSSRLIWVGMTSGGRLDPYYS